MISEEQKGKISFLESLGYTNLEYLDELRSSPEQKKVLSLWKHSDEDAIQTSTTKLRGRAAQKSRLDSVFLKTKSIITGYKRKEQQWEREKTEMQN